VTPGQVDPDSTEALLERANQVRNRLLESVEALDRKRHQLTRPVLAVGRTLEVVGGRRLQPALMVGGALLVSGALAAVVLRARRQQASNTLRNLLRPRRSFAAEVLWRAGVGLATFTAVEAGKRAIKALLEAPSRPPNGRPPNGRAMLNGHDDPRRRLTP
jgi:hypothetical protein